MVQRLLAGQPFPPVASAMHRPDGLLAQGGDLSPARLLEAYGRGIFPWFSEGQPILWWSPSQRMVLLPRQFRVPHSLVKRGRRADYLIRFDTAFDQVIAACATTPRQGQPGTWITAEMQAAYSKLHALGWAHSVECWMEGALAGGLYGVALPGVFCGESMFAHRPDASKLAFAHLVPRLWQAGFGMVDCQVYSDHLARFGASEMPRADYLNLLAELQSRPGLPQRWHPVEGPLTPSSATLSGA